MSLRVLHVTFDMRIGGTEQVIRNLIEASDQSRLDMSIFCIEEPIGPFGTMLQEKGISITSTSRRPGLDLRVIRRLRRHIRQHDIDVVHCHQYTPWVYGTLASLGLGRQVIFTEHGRFYPDRSSWKRRFINPLLARLTARVTAISEATRQALVDYEFIPARRIEVIYNGIAALPDEPEAAAQARAQYGIPANAVVLGTIARFDPIKNHPMMLRAFAAALAAHPQAQLLLVGDGEERPRLEALIQALGIEGSVTLTGYVPRPAALLAAMDIFLLPSFSEGTSMTLLEAMSLGKPCVVTKVGGNPEIVQHNETGLVTENDNLEQLTDAMKTLIASDDMRERFTQNARQRFADNYTSQAMAVAYQALYEGIQHAPSGHHRDHL